MQEAKVAIPVEIPPIKDETKGFILFLKTNNIIIKSNNIRSLQNDCHGVSLTASPKHPQSVTVFVMAEYPVKKVKNTIRPNNNQDEKFIKYPARTATPSAISNMQKKVDKNWANGTINSVPKT